jgi:hypothetical protein
MIPAYAGDPTARLPLVTGACYSAQRSRYGTHSRSGSHDNRAALQPFRSSQDLGAMRLSLPYRLASCWPGVLLAVLCIVVTSPREVRGSCSAHVLMPSAPAAASAHFQMLNLERAKTESSKRTPGEHPSSPVPCSGVLCSNNPGIPVAPAQAFPPLATDWALHSVLAPAIALQARIVNASETRLRPQHAPFSIFHPPR